MATQGFPAAGVIADDVRAWLVGADGSTPVSSTNPLPVTGGALPEGTSRSGAITTGGTAQDLAPANASRKSLTGQNISAGDLWINENGGTAAADGTDSWKVIAGASFKISTNEKVSIIGATTGQKFTATET
jgi:ABC-type multidrug transport system fused ATPase/permease subunit